MYTLDELRQNHAPIREVFFDAMLAGYASKRPKIISSADSPHCKVFEYTEGANWLVTDTYHVTPNSDYSGGVTVIYFNLVPVWMMQYFGQYPKETIPFLKEVLRSEYSRRRFTGGRGQVSRVETAYNYINDVVEAGFSRFGGIEQIRRSGDREIIGWHRYHGGLML